VDNVIYIGKDEDQIFVQSGALEYKDIDYDIDIRLKGFIWIYQMLRNSLIKGKR